MRYADKTDRSRDVVTITVRVDKELKKRLTDEAFRRGVGYQFLVRRMIERQLPAYEEQEI